MAPILAVVLLLPIGVLQGAEQPSSRLVAQNGAKYSVKDGLFELRGSRGWLRTSRFYGDFWLGFDFRVKAEPTDASVVVRGRDDRGAIRVGNRFRLPAEPVTDPSSLFVGLKDKVTVVQQGQVHLRGPGEWQQVEISAEGILITIVLNGAVVGVFQVDNFGGHVLFDNRKGRVELRNIGIAPTESRFERQVGIMTFEELRRAGGQPPKVARQVKSGYTFEAMLRKAEGVVRLEAIILADGSVGAVGIIDSLDVDLDQSAMAALKSWKFKPGRLNGKQVSVVAEVEMAFTLR